VWRTDDDAEPVGDRLTADVVAPRGRGAPVPAGSCYSVRPVPRSGTPLNSNPALRARGLSVAKLAGKGVVAPRPPRARALARAPNPPYDRTLAGWAAAPVGRRGRGRPCVTELSQAVHRTDSEFMDIALRTAADAGRHGEVPIGAVVVHEGEVVCAAANRRERDQDPTAHAEILALRDAGRLLGSWRLNDCTLYVTLEPCPMCMGAALNARLGRLVFACRDPKAGAAVSLYALGHDERLNHRMTVSEGVLRDRASAQLSAFFAGLRKGGAGPLAEPPIERI